MRPFFPMALRSELLGLHCICQVSWNDDLLDVFVNQRIDDGESQFQSGKKVSRHPVRTRKIEGFRMPKKVNAAVLEITINDADDPDIIAQTLHPWNQGASSSHNQIDLDSGL